MNLANHEPLRELINARMEEVFGSVGKEYGKQKAFINDAAERGMKISTSRLSKYLKGNEGGITEDQIVWSATRLGIFINLNLGEPALKEGKLIYEVKKYDELKCLTRLRKIFHK